LLNQGFISRDDSSVFMSLFMAAFWAMKAQGRQQAVQKITYVEVITALSNGVNATSPEFKTRAQYGNQVLSLDDEILQELTKYYIDVVRPLVVKLRTSLGYKGWRKGSKQIMLSHVTTAFKNFIFVGKEPFFLPFKNARYLRPSDYVSRFFEKTLGVHMTITKIRVIHETEAKSALEKGIITVHERNCLQRTLGHSERTANRYYCPRDRCVYYYSILIGPYLYSLDHIIK
jgi:hypothetical protein